MARTLLQLEVQREADTVVVQRRVREIAALLGFDGFEQTRINTSLSEIVRNALVYAGPAKVRFAFREDAPQALVITVEDKGGGIKNLQQILSGTYRSPTGLGRGIAGSRKLLDELEIDTSAQGTIVTMAKKLPRRAPRVSQEKLDQIASKLRIEGATDPFAELQRLSREVLQREAAMVALQHELEDTNRGVVALYAELDERAEYQRRATELKTRIVADMGHEFRTPLHSIFTIAQFLLERTDGPLNEEQERQVSMIHRTAQDMIEFVNDLLDIARAEAGRVPVRVARFGVSQLFNALKGMLRPLADRATVGLVFEEPGELPELSTDEAKISQILRNFVSNALKFTEHGEVRVRAELLPGDQVRFSVRDTGIGIDPKDHERIFEEFTQIEHDRQRRYHGSGLGLPLTKRLAALLGGDVTVESAVGRGSTFCLQIPRVLEGELAQGATVEARLASLVRQQARPVEQGLVILAIDDSEAWRYVLRHYLGGRFVVEEARNGREGLSLAQSLEPRAIFLDLVMPGMDGFEVLEQLKQDHRTREIPVVIYTAQTLTERERARLSAAAAIVRKSTASREDDLENLERALITCGVAHRLEASRG